MDSFVEEKVSAFVAFFCEAFPQSSEKMSKRMMKDKLIKFYEESLRKEQEEIDSPVSDSPELIELDKKTKELCIQMEKLDSELEKLCNRISEIQESVRKERKEDIIKSLKAKIEDVKKLYRQDRDFE